MARRVVRRRKVIRTIRFRHPIVIKVSRYQRGKTNVRRDRRIRRPALKPGLRRSKTGRKYWETRRNRSDRNRRTRL